MNKKILLGSSLGAVVILILVSFTGVVGYQTTNLSTIAKASPLFTVRSSRAIDEDSQDLSCDYVGKGEESILSIPKRDERTIFMQKIMKTINQMDEEKLEYLSLILKNYMQKDEDFNNNDLNNIREELHKLKDYNSLEIKSKIDKNKLELLTNAPICYLTNGPIGLDCIIFYIGIIIIGIIFIIVNGFTFSC